LRLFKFHTKVVAVCRFVAFFCRFIVVAVFVKKNDKKRLIHYYLLFIELLNKFTTMADPTDWWYYFKKTEQGNVASNWTKDRSKGKSTYGLGLKYHLQHSHPTSNTFH
jgi:hypothetical protein